MTYCKSMKLNELSDLNKDNFDLFICSASFEDRCLVIPTRLQGINFKKIFICNYENSYDEVDKHSLDLLLLFANAEILKLKKENPIYNLDRIVFEILRYKNSRKKKKTKVLIDISTFTHEMVLILLYLFKEQLNKNDFSAKFLYNSALDYSLFESESEKWLSKGVGEIRTVLGYSGELMPFKKTLLIILVGLESERVKSIIEIFEPNKVMLGYASKEGAITQKLHEKNHNIFKAIKDALSISITEFEFSCKTPLETENNLTQIVTKYTNDYNIIISGLNNKISTIGCALAAIKNPQIQLCYAPPLLYNTRGYSISSDVVYSIEI